MFGLWNHLAYQECAWAMHGACYTVRCGHTTGTRDYVRGFRMAAVPHSLTASIAKQNANGLALKETNKVNQMKSSMT